MVGKRIRVSTLPIEFLLRKRNVPASISISISIRARDIGGVSLHFEIFLRFAVVVALLALVRWTGHSLADLVTSFMECGSP